MLASDAKMMSARVRRLHVLYAPDDRTGETRAVWKEQRTGPLRGREALVCSALRGSLLRRCSCTIYDVRPRVCVKFERGSARCRDAREEIAEHV